MVQQTVYQSAQPAPDSAGSVRVLFGRATLLAGGGHRRQLKVECYGKDSEVFELAESVQLPPIRESAIDAELRVRCEPAVAATGGTVVAVRALTPAEIGDDRPVRDWRRLAVEQGIDLDSQPDYLSLLRALFDSQEEIAAFEHHVSAIRGQPRLDD